MYVNQIRIRETETQLYQKKKEKVENTISNDEERLIKLAEDLLELHGNIRYCNEMTSMQEYHIANLMYSMYSHFLHFDNSSTNFRSQSMRIRQELIGNNFWITECHDLNKYLSDCMERRSEIIHAKECLLQAESAKSHHISCHSGHDAQKNRRYLTQSVATHQVPQEARTENKPIVRNQVTSLERIQTITPIVPFSSNDCASNSCNSFLSLMQSLEQESLDFYQNSDQEAMDLDCSYDSQLYHNKRRRLNQF